MGSKRLFIVKELDKRLKRAAEGEIPISFGGGALIAAPRHAIDGPEHTGVPAEVVALLTNRSGGAVAEGDVVVVDTTADGSFTTTTTAAAEVSVGVALETIADDATGRVLLSGLAPLVNTAGAVTRGHYLFTSTVAKEATGSVNRGAGAFGQFLDSSATPRAWVWGVADQTAATTGGGSTLAADPPQGARVKRNSTQSITVNTDVPISFNVETQDDAGFWDSGTPTRLTAVKTGWHAVGGRIKWDAVTGLGRQLFIRQGGSTVLARHSQPGDSIHNDPYMNIHTVAYLEAGQYVEVVARTNQSTQNVTANESEGWIVFLGSGSGVPEFTGVNLTKSAVQAITNATSTAVTFDGEEFDTHGFHDNTTNPSRITIPTDLEGYYLFGGTVEMNSLADAVYTIVRLRKNGSTVLDGRGRGMSASASGIVSPFVGKPVYMVAGDYVELMVEHNHGSNRDARSSADGTSFWAIRIGVSAASTVQANEVMNFPSLEGADASQPEWWEESAGTATLTEEDVTGEGITESWERCLKVVTTADVYAYQRFTYADQPRLKVDKVVSCRVAVWAVAGATARVRLQSSVGSLAVGTATAAAWTIIELPAVVLDGTYVELRLEVNNGTAYFVPLAFGVGRNAPNELAPRGTRFRWRDAVSIKTLTGLGDEATWTDIDVTANASPLAVSATCSVILFNNDSGEDFTFNIRRNGSSLAASNATQRAKVLGTNFWQPEVEFTVILDDQQIFEYYLDREIGSDVLDYGEVFLNAWREWE